MNSFFNRRLRASMLNTVFFDFVVCIAFWLKIQRVFCGFDQEQLCSPHLLYIIYTCCYTCLCMNSVWPRREKRSAARILKSTAKVCERSCCV